MSEQPPAGTKWTWPRTIAVVAPSTLAAFAWLATCGIYIIGTAPSSSDSENMNGFVLILLPFSLALALALTATALLAAAASARSRTTKTITLALGVLILIAACATFSSARIVTVRGADHEGLIESVGSHSGVAD